MNTLDFTPFNAVKKRDGRTVPFDSQKITSAVMRAMEAAKEGNPSENAPSVTETVISELRQKYPFEYIPSIEEIQDIVEEKLILLEFPKTAKAYILYRQNRKEVRDKSRLVPSSIVSLANRSKSYFKSQLSEFIYYRTYSRWREEDSRRETWVETVERYILFMKEIVGDRLTSEEYQEIQLAILNQKIMPSMRLLWSAGKAAKATHAAAYNCSYLAPTQLSDLSEIMYLLMCGTGVGFSVESQITENLPIIKRQTGKLLNTHLIGDSKEGWCEALKLGLHTWYEGDDIHFDYSQIRPPGSRLRTMGGRSSGPAPLKSLLDFARNKILSRQAKRLKNIDLHDIICMIGEIVMMGGVRRSALISLSDLDDEEMRKAKVGRFYLSFPYRSMANNSVVYTSKPSSIQFLEEWLSLAQNGTGERGLFNRGDLPTQLPPRRWPKFERGWTTSGTNPCGEIVLQSKQFCNLTEVIARPDDTLESLLSKMKLATILGTYQSMLTDFPYLSAQWKINSQEERLLGVSITGQWDSPITRDPEVLRNLKNKAIEINRTYAERFGIQPSSSITCIKPSGTVSQLVDASSGMHPRHAPYYIRRIRISAMDPLFALLKDQKFPYQPEVGQSEHQASVYVLEFPVQSPEGAVFKNHLNAIQQLENWKTFKDHFTEHNPSVTISVAEAEWIEVAHWLYQNWPQLGGLSFLPKNDSIYPLAPFEEITKEEYQTRMKALPEIDFSKISVYENEDWTTGAKEVACIGGSCELNFESETPTSGSKKQ